ncbi:hypothetical protein NMG60_11015693 [Bertholletia excelsa]
MIKFKWRGRSLRAKVLSRVFSEDFERLVKKQTVIDPRGRFLLRWTQLFFAACLLSLFVDPLFFFLPRARSDPCLVNGVVVGLILTFMRSIADLFYFVNILVKLRTAYVAPSSRVFGRGELIVDPWKIASRYFSKGLWADLLAALPIPQVVIWGVLPNLKGPTTSYSHTSLRIIIMLQTVQRLSIFYPLTMQIAKATGFVVQTAWLWAAYNFTFYLLSSQVVGGLSYILTVQRQAACWRSVCDQDTSCDYGFLDCARSREGNTRRNEWFRTSNITNVCDPSSGYWPYGIYGPGVSSGVTTAGFLQRYFYSLWFGLRNISTGGQFLRTSMSVGENIFSIAIAMLFLLNVALVIANMQRYLQSTNLRLEEWRLKKKDKEEWMRHRQLPQQLRQSVMRYDQYKWLATQGVDEEAILNDLHKDLRRRIKRHLCLKLVRQVPLFDEMDDRMLDLICERLRPVLWTEGMFIVREGDPLSEMLFVIRGHLESYTTNGGQFGFFNLCRIGPGDFCGEELLTWVLKSSPGGPLPASLRTVMAVSDTEAFVLGAEDLRFVVSQFQRLHSEQIRQKLRLHSHNSRMRAACFIQAAWRRYRKRKELAQLNARGRWLMKSPTRVI